ncbi:hypothetical protein CBL_13047 [Carabus blaptoides fortunei]
MVKIVIVVLLILQVSVFVHSKPFLLNSTSFITHFLGSASGKSSDFNPYSENIAIIPKKSSDKLTEGSGDDNSFVFPDDSSSSTEAPGFVQRKVSKILRKLVTLSQISNALQGQYQQNTDMFQYPNFADLDNPNGSEFDRKETNVNARQEPNVSEFARKLPKGTEHEQRRLKGNDDNDRREPISYDFVTFNDKSDSDKPLRFQLEIFTSLIGLTLGAATQFNYTIGQNNTV